MGAIQTPRINSNPSYQLISLVAFWADSAPLVRSVDTRGWSWYSGFVFCPHPSWGPGIDTIQLHCKDFSSQNSSFLQYVHLPPVIHQSKWQVFIATVYFVPSAVLIFKLLLLRLKPAKCAGNKTVTTVLNTSHNDCQMAGGKWTYCKKTAILAVSRCYSLTKLASVLMS